MVTVCHSIIWSGGLFPSLTLLVLFITSFKSRMHCTSAHFLLATAPPHSPFALSLCINIAGSAFRETSVQMGHGYSHAGDTSSLPLSPFCRCPIVAGSPALCSLHRLPSRAACLCMLVALTGAWLYIQPVNDFRHRQPWPEMEQAHPLSYNEETIISLVS